MKRKFRIAMIILILSGVLLGGIGTGVAFAEFSMLEYTGRNWFGNGDENEVLLKYELSGREVDQIYCSLYAVAQEVPTLTVNRLVPQDEVWFAVTYNEEYAEPILSDGGSYRTEHEVIEEIYLWTHRKNRDSLKDFMEIKDAVLSDLKENKISSYQYTPILRVEIQVNPVNEEKILIR